MDMILYDNHGRIIDIIEIPERTHEYIFLNNDIWRSCLILRRIRDYYLRNEYIKNQELKELKADFKSISRHISADSIVFIELLLKKTIN